MGLYTFGCIMIYNIKYLLEIADSVKILSSTRWRPITPQVLLKVGLDNGWLLNRQNATLCNYADL